MLTLAEIVNATCPDIAARQAWRSYLLRCLALPEIRELAMGYHHPNYPEEALPTFRRIAQLRDLQYKPQHIAAQIRLEINDPSLVHPVSGQTGYPNTGQPDLSAAPLPSTGQEMMVLPRQASELLALLVQEVAGQAADRLAVELLPPPEDRLIHADEAAQMIACKPRSTARLLRSGGVLPVRPGVWKRSSVLRYIQQL
jgi:hypothetical protein